MKRTLTLIAGLLLVSAALAADAPEDWFTIEGMLIKPRIWSPEEIRSGFTKDIKTIKYTLKDQKHTAAAVPLFALINAARPLFNSKIKNHELRFVVVVEGKDGYTATFALTELTPEIGNREAWVALDMDGKPLPERDGPASLIVPGDQKPERWVHGIKDIRIVDIVQPPATQPSQ